MKTISGALADHLAGETTTLAFILTLTRADGVVMGFTSFDDDLVLGGVTYRHAEGLDLSAMTSGTSLATDQAEFSAALSSEAITEADIAAGRYDNARVELALVNWADPSMGRMVLRRGWLGQLTLGQGKLGKGGGFTAELRGLLDLLQREQGDFYTAECRHTLGDAQCTVNVAALTVTGAVSAAYTGNDARLRFSSSDLTQDDGIFTYGAIRWTSGTNAGLASEVRLYTRGEVTLWVAMPNPIAAGDAFTLQPGCDKRFATCRARFANGVNFGGFPTIPGLDATLTTPDAR